MAKVECTEFIVKKPITIYPGTEDNPKIVYYSLKEISLVDALVAKGFIEEVKKPATKAKKDVK